MKKIVIFCSFLLIGCFSLTAGQHPTLGKKRGTEYQNHEERLCKVEKHLQLDTRYYDYLSSYAANMYFNAELLYWTAENNGWFGFSQSEGSEPGDPTYSLTRDFDYGPGVRLGVGFKTCYDWDIYIGWTYFDHTSKDSRTGDLSQLTTPMRFERGKEEYKVKYNILDLELGRAFHAGSTLTFKPHIGLRGGWLHQSGYTEGDGLISKPTTGNWPNLSTPVVNEFYEKPWLLGLRAGFDTNLYFGKSGISVYGSLAGALVYAKTKLNYQQKLFVIDQGEVLPLVNQTINELNDIFSNLQLALGLAWADFLTQEENVALNIHAGWEANYWWDQYTSPALAFLRPDGDEFGIYFIPQPIIMQGLVVGARLDF